MDNEEPLTRLVKKEKAYMTNSRVTKEMESAGEESEDGGQWSNFSASVQALQSLTIAIVFELIQYLDGYFWGMADTHEY